MCPLYWGWPVIYSTASLKEKTKIMVFCHWFSHMKLISLPFSGSEAAVSKSAISLCCVSDSAGEILNSLCTKLFKFYIILKLCFFGVGAHWPPHLAVRALHAVCGLAVCWSLKVCFPTQHPFLVRFWSSLLGAHSAAYWLKMYSPLVWSLWGPMGERKTNSATVLILRIDTCLFKIKNQSLQSSDLLDFYLLIQMCFFRGNYEAWVKNQDLCGWQQKDLM